MITAKSQEWVLTDGLPADFMVRSISFDGGKTYVVGNGRRSRESTLYSSSNGGKMWEKVCDIQDVLAGSMLVCGSRILMSGYYQNEYVVFYSDNEGKNWTLIPDISDRFLTSSLFKSGARLMAVGSMTDQGRTAGSALYSSTDNGASWTRQDLPEDFGTITSAAASGQSIVFSLVSPEGFIVVRTADGGKTWGLSDVKVPLVSVAGVCSTADAFYLAGRISDGTSVVLVSKDGGASFTKASTLSSDISVQGLFPGPDCLFLMALNPDYQSFIAFKPL